MISVDQAVQDSLSPDGTGVGEVGDRPRVGRLDQRWSLVTGLMRAVPVIVLGILGDDLGEMFLVEDQHLVEHLATKHSDYAHTSFRAAAQATVAAAQRLYGTQAAQATQAAFADRGIL
ncbi:MAG: hypothetical protein JWN52_1699 [Actinomycetia bacterium]|nr:hypothetical protein [Actinomycetes bacterium]